MEVTPTDVNKILNTMDDLKANTQLLVMGILLVVFVYFLVKLVLAHRAQQKLEDGKNARAKSYQESFERLATCLETHTVRNEAEHSNLAAIMAHTTLSLTATEKSITGLCGKVSGKISMAVSIDMIRAQFSPFLAMQYVAIIQRSLIDNDFANRQTYVEDKVRTELRGVLMESRHHLRRLNLSVDPDQFFTLSESSAGERFVLVDLVWNKIKPLYLMKEPIRERIAEASLSISNVIQDYLVMCAQRAGVEIEFRHAVHGTSIQADPIMPPETDFAPPAPARTPIHVPMPPSTRRTVLPPHPSGFEQIVGSVPQAGS